MQVLPSLKALGFLAHSFMTKEEFKKKVDETVGELLRDYSESYGKKVREGSHYQLFVDSEYSTASKTKDNLPKGMKPDTFWKYHISNAAANIVS